MDDQRPLVRLLRVRYLEGRTTAEQVAFFLTAGRITQAEHDWIVGG